VNKNTHGFTLIELLVTVIVITILGITAIAMTNNSVARAADASRVLEVQNISRALNLYSANNAGFLPIDKNELENDFRDTYLTSFESDPINKIEGSNIIKYVYTVSKDSTKFKFSAILQTGRFASRYALNSIDNGNDDQRYEIGNTPNLDMNDTVNVVNFYIERNQATQF